MCLQRTMMRPLSDDGRTSAEGPPPRVTGTLVSPAQMAAEGGQEGVETLIVAAMPSGGPGSSPGEKEEP